MHHPVLLGLPVLALGLLVVLLLSDSVQRDRVTVFVRPRDQPRDIAATRAAIQAAADSAAAAVAQAQALLGILAGGANGNGSGNGTPSSAAGNDTTDPCQARPWLCSDKVAVLIETRMHDKLLPTLDNFLTHLPVDWRFQLFLSANNTPAVLRAPLIKFFAEQGRVVVTPAPKPEELTTIQGYSALLQSAAFWESLLGEHVLIFQPDAVLCRASPHKIDDFLQFDYVGAPWPPPWSQDPAACGNGGLSLRSRSKMLEVITGQPGEPGINEDAWFCRRLRQAQLPNLSTAASFSVETVFHPRPFGVHKFWAHIKDSAQRKQLFEHCPEALAVAPPPG